MKHYILKSSALSLAAVAVLGMSGCNSTSSDATDENGDSTAPEVVENIYKGALSLAGTVDVGNIAKAPVRHSLVRRADSATSDEIVELYVLNEQGEMEDTNISCPVDPATHAYECSNIAGDQEYIVRYMKNLGDGRVYEMKTSVTVEDKDVADQKVNKITSLIVDAISQAIEEGLASVKSVDKDTIKTLMKTVKASVVKSVSTLIEKGIIKIPDDSAMIITLEDGKTFDDFKKSVESNDQLEKASSVIVSDESVTKVLDSSKNEVKLQSYAEMTKEQIIVEIFNQFGDDDGGVPQWIINFLADTYDKQLNIADINSKLEFKVRDNLADEKWIIQDLQRAGVSIDTAGLITMANTLATQINTGIESGKLLADFKAQGEAYLQAKKDNNVDVLATFPPIIGFLFGNGLPTEKFDNSGQLLAFTMYADSVYIPDIIAKTLKEQYELDDNYIEMLKHFDIGELNYDFLLTQLGLSEATLASYDAPEVESFHISMDRAWVPDGGEKEFMTFRADFSRAIWMMGGFEFDPAKLTSAELTYPTESGAKTKTLTVDQLKTDSWGSGFGISYDPWPRDCDDFCEPDKKFMDITDNVSGDYTITIEYDGAKFTKTFSEFVLQDAESMRPVLTSPLAMPEWPEILNNANWDNLTPEQQAAQDAFDKAQREYQVQTGGLGYTAFEADENGEANDLVISWDDISVQTKIAALNLPENIVPAYEVGVSLYEPDLNQDGTVDENERNTCNQNWDQCNTEIFNTWWSNRPVKGTSLILPTTLKENSGEGRYQVHVDLMFIDRNTNEPIARGGHSFAEFKVGKAAQLSGSEVVTFKGKVALDGDSATYPDNLKVGFMKDQCTFDPETMTGECTSTTMQSVVVNTDGTYSLEVNASAIQQMMLENQNSDLNFGLITFEDTNQDDKWDMWTPETQNDEDVELAWWPENGWINFDSWGGFKLHVGYQDKGDETKMITKDSSIEVDGIDFTIYNDAPVYEDEAQEDETTE